MIVGVPVFTAFSGGSVDITITADGKGAAVLGGPKCIIAGICVLVAVVAPFVASVGIPNEAIAAACRLACAQRTVGTSVA